MHVTIKTNHKSINPPAHFELQNFSVLTGKNGSGKTHMLEAMSNSNVSEVKINGKVIQNVRYIKFNELNPIIPDTCDPQTITQHAKKVWQEFELAKKGQRVSRGSAINLGRPTISTKPVSNPDFQKILQHINEGNSLDYIKNVLEKANKEINAISEDDFVDYFDSSYLGSNEFFSAQFALIFKNYHKKLEENKINRYYQTIGESVYKQVLSDEEFIDIYGNPPWEFVNQILEQTNIPYKVNDPLGSRASTTYKFKLIDKHKGFEINSQDLSTGEKVLMSLALAIYNTGGNAGKPDLLLIDEPDAALHPSMSKLMVEIINKNIVNDNGIPTVITTHSPTTIIATQGISIFQMTRGSSVPERIPVQKAVEILSSDIPFLKISNERRRQVIVESKYDVNYYELLTNILSRKESIPAEPIYLPARTSSGSNCTDVIELVSALFQNGNDQVYGIIDWDLKNKPTERIIVLGEERYSIENYILDPLLMGLLFIRERKFDCLTFGEISITTYSEVGSMLRDDAQVIMDKVLNDLGLNSADKAVNKLYNSWELSISVEFNRKQGHDLEKLYKEKYPFLRSYTREDGLKKDVIEKIINDYPQFVSSDIFETIKKIK
jgi:ABC-type cobalamin/Fe3+-siderophores transport system ATPase subunit